MATTPMLKDKVAVVTGAARGIGREIAILMAQCGAKVVVNDYGGAADGKGGERGPADDVVNEIKGHGGEAAANYDSVSTMAGGQAIVQTALDQFGSIDIVVNNAGILRDRMIFNMTEEEWDAVINTHLKGSFIAARATQKYMVEQKYGKMMFISSTSALGNRGQANYSTVKAGLQGLTRTLAIELGPFNINVNAVAPGFIETRMTQQTAERLGMDWEQFKKDAASRTPVRRTGKPEDVANVIAFLVSDESSFVSGQIVYVAGGPRG